MTKAVEPLTDGQIEAERQQLAHDLKQVDRDSIIVSRSLTRRARLLATIEADREKLAEITDQAARQIAASGMAINELKERAEAAEAHVSELEKELGDLTEAVITLDLLGGEHIYLMALEARTKLQTVPTPPVKGEG